MSDQKEKNIEQQLNSTFTLVEPDPEFVRKLGHRLIWHPETIVIEKIQPLSITILAGLILLAIMAIVVWLLERNYRSKS